MMPLAAIDRWRDLYNADHPQPDIETMNADDLVTEIDVCKYFEGYHRVEGIAIGKLNPDAHRYQAHVWFRRRLRVQELLARGAGRAAS